MEFKTPPLWPLLSQVEAIQRGKELFEDLRVYKLTTDKKKMN